MKLAELLDTAVLERHVTDRVVTTRSHPKLPLTIYNYTAKATYDEVWDAVTKVCRGLIVAKPTGDIIARPFPKFWNIGQYPETQEANLPKTVPEVSEKLDGSLGIFWQYEGESGIATRGIFDSEQAIWATRWWKQNVKAAELDPRMTWLFEIIFPENRIVCDYDFEGLVLLAVIETDTGVEWTTADVDAAAQRLGVRRPKRFDKSLAECLADNRLNEEGYVLTWRSTTGPSLRAKVKFAEYVRLHKLLTGMSERDVWEVVSTGRAVEPLLERTPQDFQVWLLGLVAQFKEKYAGIENQAEEILREARARIPGEPKDRETRKALAAVFTKHKDPLPAVLFNKLDGQHDRAREAIWKSLYPEGGRVFKIEKEDRA